MLFSLKNWSDKAVWAGILSQCRSQSYMSHLSRHFLPPSLDPLFTAADSQYSLLEWNHCVEFPHSQKHSACSWSLAWPALPFLDTEIMVSSTWIAGCLWVTTTDSAIISCYHLTKKVSVLPGLTVQVHAQNGFISGDHTTDRTQISHQFASCLNGQLTCVSEYCVISLECYKHC
jgi:hypothetical protein